MHAIVVPAELVYPRDRIDGPTLKRLKVALQLWRTGGVDLIAVTGGIFLPVDVQTEPAAVLMARWLKEHGVPEGRIIIEAEALDTFENVALTHALLSRRTSCSQQWTIVSHPTHLRRFALTCRAHDIRMRPHAVDERLPLTERLGEFAAWLMHRFDPRGTGRLARRNRARRQSRTWRPAALLESAR